MTTASYSALFQIDFYVESNFENYFSVELTCSRNWKIETEKEIKFLLVKVFELQNG